MTRCPYASLVGEFPTICDIHGALLNGILRESGQPIEVASLDVWAREDMCVARLRREDLLTLGKSVEKSTDNLLAAIETSKRAELWRVIHGLGITHVGVAGDEMSAAAIAQVELLNRQLAAVREQLEQLNAALDAAKLAAKDKDLKIEELGRELNLALAARVTELARYRSEFFGRLQAVLGERKDVQIVGDRFVFSSEVLFPTASDEVSADGMIQLTRLAETLKTLAAEIPDDLPWVLQVDGHTDRRPISNARFPSNWELSTARALAIVKFLRTQGIPPQRLAATGYGEFHALDARNTEEAYARNRRIELKLTSR